VSQHREELVLTADLTAELLDLGREVAGSRIVDDP
jgi:hypothetical protein